MEPVIVCFGESMMRLNPEGYLKLIQASKFIIGFAGAESNVAVSLANYGLKARYVTKLPNNDIGKLCINDLRKYGVDTTYILKGGERIGIDYVEKGASQRSSKVIYDRKYSSVSMAEPGEYDWDKIFANASWFHFTGITPALSPKTAEAVLDACKSAKKLNILISCDLNYRNKLWSKLDASNVMSGLMKYVDLCICNEEDANEVFNINAPDTDVTKGKISKEGYKSVINELVARFGFKSVAITLRNSISASKNIWSAIYFTDNEFYYSKEYSIDIVDRIGGGDSFGAALIFASLRKYSPQKRVDFSVAASCLKQTIEGDYNLVSVEDVENLMNGDTTGRIKR